MRVRGLFVTATITLAASGCTAPPQQPPSPVVQQQMQQLPPGRVYAFDSSAQGGCPGLNWHIILQSGGVLSGLIAWNNMQSVARANGTVNTQTGTFQMTATEVGGQGRTATINGTVNTNDGSLTANIQGPNVSCRGITVPWFVPYKVTS